jgi:hypothetical protein
MECKADFVSCFKGAFGDSGFKENMTENNELMKGANPEPNDVYFAGRNAKSALGVRLRTIATISRDVRDL